MNQILLKWLIRLSIIYVVLGLLDSVMNWKLWILIVIGALGVYLLVFEILFFRNKELVKILPMRNKEFVLNWMINFIIFYFIVSLLENIFSWRTWLLIGIGLILLVFLIVWIKEYIERKKETKVQVEKIKSKLNGD